MAPRAMIRDPALHKSNPRGHFKLALDILTAHYSDIDAERTS